MNQAKRLVLAATYGMAAIICGLSMIDFFQAALDVLWSEPELP